MGGKSSYFKLQAVVSMVGRSEKTQALLSKLKTQGGNARVICMWEQQSDFLPQTDTGV